MPLVVARRGLVTRLERMRTSFFEPLLQIIVVKLFAPQHPCQRLPHHVRFVGIESVGNDSLIELVRFLLPQLQNFRKLFTEWTTRLTIALRERARRPVGKQEPNHLAAARWHRHMVMRSGLR